MFQQGDSVSFVTCLPVCSFEITPILLDRLENLWKDLQCPVKGSKKGLMSCSCQYEGQQDALARAVLNRCACTRTEDGSVDSRAFWSRSCLLLYSFLHVCTSHKSLE